MHKIQIRAIGRPHETWHPQSIHSLLTRLRPFAKVEVIELPEAKSDNAAKASVDETERLLKGVVKDAWLVALDASGHQFDSVEFAGRLNTWGERGRQVVFIIGGSNGLDRAQLSGRADAILSFGKLTLPHLLARIVLLEQIYRAETILAGKAYHK